MTSRRLGTVLAIWSIGFAVAHAAWAFGWRGGTPADVAPISERPVFWAYDIVAGLLIFAAGVVALFLAYGGLTRVGRGRLEVLTLVGACLALARGVPGLVTDAVTTTWSGLGPLADAWFVVAGSLGVLLWRLSRRTDDRVVDPSARRSVRA